MERLAGYVEMECAAGLGVCDWQLVYVVLYDGVTWRASTLSSPIVLLGVGFLCFS